MSLIVQKDFHRALILEVYLLRYFEFMVCVIQEELISPAGKMAYQVLQYKCTGLTRIQK